MDVPLSREARPLREETENQNRVVLATLPPFCTRDMKTMWVVFQKDIRSPCLGAFGHNPRSASDTCRGHNQLTRSILFRSSRLQPSFGSVSSGAGSGNSSTRARRLMFGYTEWCSNTLQTAADTQMPAVDDTGVLLTLLSDGHLMPDGQPSLLYTCVHGRAESAGLPRTTNQNSETCSWRILTQAYGTLTVQPTKSKSTARHAYCTPIPRSRSMIEMYGIPDRAEQGRASATQFPPPPPPHSTFFGKGAPILFAFAEPPFFDFGTMDEWNTLTMADQGARYAPSVYLSVTDDANRWRAGPPQPQQLTNQSKVMLWWLWQPFPRFNRLVASPPFPLQKSTVGCGIAGR